MVCAAAEMVVPLLHWATQEVRSMLITRKFLETTAFWLRAVSSNDGLHGVPALAAQCERVSAMSVFGSREQDFVGKTQAPAR